MKQCRLRKLRFYDDCYTSYFLLPLSITCRRTYLQCICSRWQILITYRMISSTYIAGSLIITKQLVTVIDKSVEAGCYGRYEKHEVTAFRRQSECIYIIKKIGRASCRERV